jgi:nicotinamide-nucleotide amidase
MRAEIITIGDEILIGQIVDTNSAWMGQQLNLNGIHVHQISSVSDHREHILKALAEAESRADVILITGGLGPTKDDITKKTLCDYFETDLVLNELVLEDVTKIFASFNRGVSDINKKQAEVPRICEVIRNGRGTAPGMVIYRNNKMFVTMPGVPHEMKAMVSEQVIPLIQSKYDLPFIFHKTVLTQGIGESVLAEKIENWENELANKNIKLAYLPSMGAVRLRLSTSGVNFDALVKNIEDAIEKLVPQISEFIYGYEIYGEEQKNIAALLIEKLKSKQMTISTAESCTGGFIASQITAIAGSSAVFKGSIVAYDNVIKEKFLNVPATLIKEKGAVSIEVVELMAKEICKQFNTDCSIAVSGIAGPDGGTNDKPVGTICIAIKIGENLYSKQHKFFKVRQRNIEFTSQTALSWMLKTLE